MYLKETLSKDEKIIKRINKGFSFPIILLIIGFILLVIGIFYNSFIYKGISIIIIFFTVIIIIKLNAIEMFVTNKRVISKRGIFKIETEELKLEQIESIKINNRSIIFTGTGGSKVKFTNVANVVTAKKDIENVITTREKTEINSINNISKKQDLIIKNKYLICPKCNKENNRINSFCTNCHYIFTKEDKNSKMSIENTKTEVKNLEVLKQDIIEKENDKETEDLKKQINLLKEEIKKEKELKQEAINRIHDREIGDLKEQIKLLTQEIKEKNMK